MSTAMDGLVTTDVTIEKVSEVLGHEGAQWELAVRWPWTPANARYADRCWIDKGKAPDVRAGHYMVDIVSLGIKAAAEGKGSFDGSQRWMHRWKIIRFVDTVAPQPVVAAPLYKPPGEPSIAPEVRYFDDRQQSIERQTAFKGAIELAGHLLSLGTSALENDETLVAWIADKTAQFRGILAGTPIAQTHQGEGAQGDLPRQAASPATVKPNGVSELPRTWEAFWPWALKVHGKRPKDVKAVLGSPLQDWLLGKGTTVQEAAGLCDAAWKPRPDNTG